MAPLLFVAAVAFAAVYYPARKYLARGWVSPYAKVDVWRRFGAAGVDAALVASAVVLYEATGWLGFFLAGGVYLGARDLVGGQSIGKWLFDLTVIHIETGRPVTPLVALARNVVLLLPGANVVAIVLEARTIAIDPQGQRLGDLLANTQVIDGDGVRALARACVEWWQQSLTDVARVDEAERAPDVIGCQGLAGRVDSWLEDVRRRSDGHGRGAGDPLRAPRRLESGMCGPARVAPGSPRARRLRRPLLGHLRVRLPRPRRVAV